MFADIIQNKLLESGFEVVKEVDASCDLLVVASHGQIVSKKVLETAKHGALNVHPSLLPKNRGPSPIQTTLLQGDTETGVTIMLMDEEIDHGPILAMESYDMKDKKYTYEELHKKLGEMGADLLVKTIPKWIEGKISPKEQEHDKATYTEKLTREDGKIDWTKPAVYIERQIRAFYPWPGTFTFWAGKRVKILKAHVTQDKLVIDELQLEGKKPTTMQEFLLGHKDFYVGP